MSIHIVFSNQSLIDILIPHTNNDPPQPSLVYRFAGLVYSK